MDKKIIIIAIAIIIFSAISVSAQTINFEFKKSLGLGSRGEDVTELQKFLKGFSDIYPEGLVTGYFGSRTEAAVKRFQTKNGISPVGIVGPKTRTKLNELIAKARPAAPAASATPATPATPPLSSAPISKAPATALTPLTGAPTPLTATITAPTITDSSFKLLFTIPFRLWTAGMSVPSGPGPFTYGYGKVENGVQTGTWSAWRFDYGTDGWMQINLHAPSPCQTVGDQGWCSTQTFRPTLIEIMTIPLLGYELLTPSAGKQIKMEWELAVDRPITLAAEADQSFHLYHERIMSCPAQRLLPRQPGEADGWRKVGCTVRMPTIYGLPTDPRTGGGGVGIFMEVEVPADAVMWVRTLNVWMAD